jgi:hypothetical protein
MTARPDGGNTDHALGTRRPKTTPLTVAPTDWASGVAPRSLALLSPRSVEWLPRKVFAQLEIHSRRELRKALPDSDSGLVPG